MNRIFLTVTFLFLLACQVFNQNRQGLSNIEFNLIDNQLIIDYNLNLSKGSEQEVLLVLWNSDHSIMIPESLSGDFGKSIAPGANKQIQWNIVEDNALLSGRLKPELILKSDFYQKKGSHSALYSLIIPGMGAYFVTDVNQMVFKPYLRTVTSLSFIGLGIKASNMKSREALYSDWVNPRTGKTEKRFHGYGPYNYWLFDYDSAVFLGLGLAIWIYDVIWVAHKGGRNDKLKKAFKNLDVSYDGLSEKSVISINYSF